MCIANRLCLCLLNKKLGLFWKQTGMRSAPTEWQHPASEHNPAAQRTADIDITCDLTFSWIEWNFCQQSRASGRAGAVLQYAVSVHHQPSQLHRQQTAQREGQREKLLIQGTSAVCKKFVQEGPFVPLWVRQRHRVLRGGPTPCLR